MSDVETIKISCPENTRLGFKIINAEDFDPDKHELAEPAAGSADAGSPAPTFELEVARYRELLESKDMTIPDDATDEDIIAFGRRVELADAEIPERWKNQSKAKRLERASAISGEDVTDIDTADEIIAAEVERRAAETKPSE